MRYFYLVFFLIFLSSAYSQEQPNTCFVLFVKGEIKKPSGLKLIQGDTVSSVDLASLSFETPGAKANLFENSVGTFQIMKGQIISSSKKGEKFFAFLSHLLKIKGHPVSLSSRGDCNCVTPQACFIPDTNLNDKVLLIDELSFRADDAAVKAEMATYYINYNGKKNLLKINDGSVHIRIPDLVFKDTAFNNGETPDLIIGLYLKNGSGTFNDLIAKLKFNIVPDSVLSTYYKTLRFASGESDLIKLKQAFVNDVYLYFGKPNECQIDKIINSIKD